MTPDITVQIEQAPQVNVSIESTEVQVTMEQAPPIIVTISPMGERGLPGPKGEPGEGGVLTKTLPAGENISSGVPVVVQNGTLLKFNPNDLTHLGRVIGISKTSGLSGQNVTVQVNGETYDAAYELVPEKPCFCNAQGICTQIPNTKIIQPIGVSIDSKTFMIQILSPIKT